MRDAAMVTSIASIDDGIGARAARHMDSAFRAILRPPAAEHQPGYMRFITGEAHPLGNAAILASPGDATVARAAAEPLRASGLPCAVLFTGEPSPAAGQALEAMDFTFGGAMPAMAVDIDALAGTALPAGYEWSRCRPGDDAAAWTAAFAEGYQIPPGLARAFSPEALGDALADDGPLQFFAVLRHGQPVATSVYYLADGLAGVYCVSTLPGERSRGLGAHATAQALREARARGYRVGVLQSSAAGHSVYLKLGFEDVGGVPMYVRMPE